MTEKGDIPAAKRRQPPVRPTRPAAAATRRPGRRAGGVRALPGAPRSPAAPGGAGTAAPAGRGQSGETKNMPSDTFFQAEKLFCIIKKHYFWGATNR